MPHQCVRCGKFVQDGNRRVLDGCEFCGCKLFFFIKEDKLDKIKKDNPVANLSEKDKDELEKDVFEIIGKDKSEIEEAVILDFESIRVLKPGKYELDLVHLFKNDPVIFKLSEGKYMIDLPTSFKNAMKKD